MLALFAGLVPAALWAQPSGGQVVAGEATLAAAAGSLTVTQNSARAIINWQDFSLGAGDFARFVQPDATSATLNRVISGLPSTLAGTLEANGRVFLINPNGVVIGAGARIDTAGFLASTLDVANQEFLAGGDLHFSGESTAAIQNLGSIQALGGDVFLIARQVENVGTIAAAKGTAGLAAGSEVLLTTGGDERLFVSAASAPGAMLNAGTIAAATAELRAAGGNAYALAINNSGVVRATGSAMHDGQLWLVASGESTVASSGTLDVSSTTGDGGRMVVTAGRVRLDDGARLDATGATGGGSILVLGGTRDGGRVTVGGTLDAGSSIGDGGFIETSAVSVIVTDQARVTTSALNGRSGTWLIDPVDFTIAASGGDMTGAAVGLALAGGNFTIQSTTGAAGTAGDVNVNDPVSWSANKLTLNAHNNINVNAVMNGSGTASLALEFGQGAVAAGNASVHVVQAAIHLPAGNNFSTKLGSDGAVKNYTVITSLGAQGSTTATDLQGMNGNLAGLYALGADIDASATSTWNTGAGFTPVSTGFSKFTGTFDGLGHTISNLTINSSSVGSYVGLFGFAEGATIRNVGLVGGSVTGGEASYVGGLLGYNYFGSTVSNSYNTGSVTRNGTTTSGRAGGLVGTNFGAIRDSYATGNVSGVRDVGGLTGGNDTDGTITNSYATGNVSGTHNQIGGLVGILNGGTVTKSHATGAVSANDYVGGLVGIFWAGTVSDAYATGNVSGRAGIGGLVGSSQVTATTVFHSYATGTVSGMGNTVGGLMGNNGGTVSESYATGSVSTTGLYAGGLLGATNGTVSNSYATGNVSGTTHVGGLTGYANGTGTVSNTYAVGSVTGTGFVGGLLGRRDNTATVSNSFWNSTVIAAGIGSDTNIGDTAGASGRTTAEMMTLANFGNAGWGIASTGGAGAVWRIYEGSTTPWLTYFLKPLTVTVNDDAKTYNGLAYTGGNGVVYSVASPSPALAGTLAYVGTAQSAVNAGTYVLNATGLASVQQGYDISYVAGALTVNKANLTLTGSQVYNGLTAFAGGNLTAAGVNGETFTMTGAGATGNLTTKDVQTNQPLASLAGLAIGTGNTGAALASNYNLLITGSSVSVTQADLTLSGTRVYDGSTIFAGSHLTATGVNGETFTVTGAGAAGNLGTKNVQTNQALASVGGLAVGTGNSGAALADNYHSLSISGSSVSVTPLALTITGFASDNKVYNGSTTAVIATPGTLAGVISGDTVGFSHTGAAFDTKDVGTGKTVTLNGVTLTGSGDEQNYTFTAVTTDLSDITPATLTYTADLVDRTYGSANPSLTGTVGGFTTGETEATATTGAAVFTTTATVTSNVGTYAINGSGLTAKQGNYVFVQAPGNATALTINKADLLLSGTRVYDGTTIFGGNLLTATGVLGETFSVTGAGAAGNLTTRHVQTNQALASVGGLALGTSGNGGLAGNYNALAVTGSQVSVTPAALTITANDAAKTYGQTTTFGGSEFTSAGLVTGDTIGSVGLASSGAAATAGVAGSPYAIAASAATGGSFAATDYTISYVNGALTVTPAALTITANDASKTYGQTTTFTGTEFMPGGLQNGETVGSVTLASTGAAATAGVAGSPYAITATGATGGTFDAANYTLSYVNGALTITPATLTITANDASKTFGQTTTFAGTEFTATGLQNGETVGSVALTSLGAAATATVTGSPYAITPAAATGGTFSAANYALSYVDGVLTVTDLTTPPPVANVPLTITADNKTKVYGAPLPVFTATFNGFINGDTSASVTGLQFSTTATIGSNVGTYTITPFGATAPAYYTVGYVAGILTIAPAQLTITANNVTRRFGETTPDFTASHTGFVNGDTVSVVSGLTFNTAATSSPEDFTIIPGGAVATNYTLIYVNGLLHIVMPVVPVGGNDQPVVLIGGEPVLTPDFAVIEQNGRPVFVSLSGSGEQIMAPDEQLVITLGEATSPPSLADQSANPVLAGLGGLGGPNFGNFELVASLDGGGRPDATQAGEPGLFRESSVNMGGFNVVYHEALDDARQQEADNTALGSSYREFSDSDNPQVNLVRTKVDRKPGESTAGPSS